MNRSLGVLAHGLLGLLTLSGAAFAQAKPATPGPRALAPTATGTIVIDGFFREWSGMPLWPARTVISGQLADDRDLDADVRLAFDAVHVFVAIEVRDDLFVPGDAKRGDRLRLVFVPAEGKPHHLQVVLNDLEKRQPTLQMGGRPVAGARLFGTTRKDGWAVELAIPHRAIPGLLGAPLRFAAIIDDVDFDPQSVEATVATGPLDAQGLPTGLPLTFGDPTPLVDRYRAARKQSAEPLRVAVADIVDGATPEAVIVSAEEIALVGYDLPGAAPWMFFQHGWRPGAEVRRFELVELDGRPGLELIVERSEWLVPGETRVEILEVYGVRSGFLMRLFAQQIGEEAPDLNASARAEIEITGKKGPRVLQVTPAKVSGFNPGNALPPGAHGRPSYEPLPWPWQNKKPQRFELRDNYWQRK